MALLVWTCARTRHPIKVAVTTEVVNTGLVQTLTQTFTRTGGPPIDLQVAGADDVFLRGSKDQVSVTITNDAQKEMDFIRSGHSRLYTKFAYDDLLILGPPRDRAMIRNAASVVEAFQRIAKHKSRFCSPGGFALAHSREATIWKMASVDPTNAKWYLECPGDALTALREADRTQAYTISDRSSLAALPDHLHLKVLLEGDRLLHNDYAAILVAHQPRTSADRDAEWFVEWLSSYAARQAVENFRTADGRRFFPVEAVGGR
jgi:tungstate transport system substrate-binding protein